MSNASPRIEPLPEAEWDEDVRGQMERLRRPDGMVFNIFRTLARHPALMRKWLGFGTHVLRESTLPARERELAILRTGWLCRAEYEWGHHVEIGKAAGLSDAEIRRCAEGAEAEGWAPFDAAIIRAVDELHESQRMSDASWAALSERYSTRQMMDFVFAVGQYHLVSMALNSFGVRLEEGYEGFPGGVGS